MTSAPVRDPLADHLITPQNAALLLIDYQPAQLAGVRSMDRALLVKTNHDESRERRGPATRRDYSHANDRPNGEPRCPAC
jgi:hypothetical protein